MTGRRVQAKPYPLGAHREADGISVSFASKEANCGVVLYDRATGRRIRKIPFGPQERMGRIYYKWIPDVDASRISYQFYEGDRVVADRHARVFVSKSAYGRRREEKDMKAGFLSEEFDWEGDRSPRIPYEDCICYCMHVRGFTKHISSGVEHRGCFRGVMEKIPYLKELGITTVELQPAYEFLEMSTQDEAHAEVPSGFTGAGQEGESGTFEEEKKVLDRINYWGYKKGYYYAPKEGYASGEDASVEFKEMVKAFHAEGMEVVMQFYFPKEVPEREIPEILRFWVLEYHVDGFHLMGERLPLNLIATDDGLTDTKLWYYDFDADRIYGEEDICAYRNLAVYRDDYMFDMRRFLKGDGDMVNSILYHMRNNPKNLGRINYFTNYYGFTLMDLVSYDEKHNMENGENNRDGAGYNASWNCGMEGATRRKQILALRRKQIKNALCMLFLSQGTPLIFMGDEFGNSQKGNNNPYCQDNEVTWLNWKDLQKNRDIYECAKELIALRKAHPILHQERELKIMDYISCGYPDLSYHGEEAWRPSLDGGSHHVGIMYCGKYARVGREKEDDFFYVALNMHWEAHEFAMPKLPRGLRWELLLETDMAGESIAGKSMAGKSMAGESIAGRDLAAGEEQEQRIMSLVPPRTVAVFISRGTQEQK